MLNEDIEAKIKIWSNNKKEKLFYIILNKNYFNNNRHIFGILINI